MVRVNDIIVFAQLVNLFEGNNRLAAAGILAGEADAMVTLEDLVVGVAGYVMRLVYPTGVQGLVHCLERYLVLEDGFETVGLLLLVR